MGKNRKYLEKIKAGMDCLAAMPNGLYTGKGLLGYNPETGKITCEGERNWIDNTNHLANLMGGFEVLMELCKDVDHKNSTISICCMPNFMVFPAMMLTGIVKKMSGTKIGGGILERRDLALLRRMN